MAVDGQYAHTVLICDGKIRGTAICHTEGKWSECGYAGKYEHPDEVLT